MKEHTSKGKQHDARQLDREQTETTLSLEPGGTSQTGLHEEYAAKKEGESDRG